jgi:putative selenium metabolism hydrolase
MDIHTVIREKSIAYREYTAKNLSSLVQVPSLCGKEGALIQVLEGILEEAGFEEVKIDGLGNLIGRIGSGEKLLAIDAHVDTVAAGDLHQWEKAPFSGERADGFIWGRGAVDQKGGAASMITAGRILRELGYNGCFTIWFTFTVMEEDCEGLCWNYMIEKEKLVPDYVVITEPTNLGVYRGHRGRMEIELFFTGVSSHGSAPERGVNAIYKALDGVGKIRELNHALEVDDFLGKGSVAVTSISSRSPSLCSIPDSCMIHLDRRLTWGETLESAVAEVRDLVGDEVRIEVPPYECESYKGTLFRQKKYFPTWKIPEDHPLVEAGMDAFTLLFEESPVVGKWTFSTNGVSICGSHGIPTIGFGPGNELFAHAPGERIPLEDCVKASAFYAFLPHMLEKKHMKKTK